VIGRAAYTIYSILGIIAGSYFPMITHNATKVSADAKTEFPYRKY